MSELKARVLEVVGTVPEGCVTTYRDIAGRLGAEPREVARVLGRLTPEEADAAPWHRVVGDGGWLGAPKGDAAGRSQEERLAAEGLAIGGGRVEAFETVRAAAESGA